MGSPLGPSLANVFLAHYESIWLSNCPDELNLRIVKDMLIL